MVIMIAFVNYYGSGDGDGDDEGVHGIKEKRRKMNIHIHMFTGYKITYILRGRRKLLIMIS